MFGHFTNNINHDVRLVNGMSTPYGVFNAEIEFTLKA